jgi:hypothetical protein
VASPGFLAACGVLVGLCLHPALPVPPPTVVTAALVLLLLAGLLAGARGLGGRLLALGALATVLALGYDGLRGNRGTLTLEGGQGANRFEEEGPDRRPLGLRPLGFDLALEKVEPGGDAVLRTGADARLIVGPGRPASQGGLRLGLAAPSGGGEPSVLKIGVAGPEGMQLVEVASDAPASVDGLDISLESYFPDFALDARQQPYSRSNEARNPAALLRVKRGSDAWRVFVIRAMPGIHKPEGLDRVLSLAEVVPRDAVTLRVSREPAAALALGGVLLMAVGMALGARSA